MAVFKADNGPLEVGGSWNRPPQTSLFRRRIDDDYDEVNKHSPPFDRHPISDKIR